MNENVKFGQTAEEEKVKNEIEIVVENHVPFDPQADVLITTTTEFAKEINSIFSGVFADYYGCTMNVQFNPDIKNYIVVPNLYFKVLPVNEYSDDAYYAFNPIGVGSNAASPVERVQRMSAASVSGTKCLITDEGKSGLSKFVVKPNNGKFDWATAYKPFTTNNNTFVVTYKYDIIKLIELVFGSTDDEGSKVFYQVIPTYPINSQLQYKSPDEWNINIQRLHNDSLKAAANKLGLAMPQQTSGPSIITDVK